MPLLYENDSAELCFELFIWRQWKVTDPVTLSFPVPLIKGSMHPWDRWLRMEFINWMLPMCKAYARQSGDMEGLVWIQPLRSYCGGFPATKDKVGVNHQCPLLGASILMIYFASSSCVYISYILTPCTNIYVEFNPLFSLHNKSASTMNPWDSSWIFGGENEVILYWG